MSAFTGSLDLHKEQHTTDSRSAPTDNHNTVQIAAGIVCCSLHPGVWIAKDKESSIVRGVLGVKPEKEIRDCPMCLRPTPVQPTVNTYPNVGFYIYDKLFLFFFILFYAT